MLSSTRLVGRFARVSVSHPKVTSLKSCTSISATKLVLKPCLVQKNAYSTMLTRVTPLNRNLFLERKGKGGQKRRNDDYDDDEEDEVEVSPKGGKGGKPAAPAPSKGGKPAAKAPAEFDVKNSLATFDGIVKKYQTDLTAIKIGRAEPQLLASVKIDGESLNVYGQVQVRDPQTLTVSLYDTTLIPKVTKAITAAEPSLNPNSDGKVIIVPVPKPTPEHKRNLLKTLSNACEKAKVDIRNARRDAMTELKGYALPKDENKSAETQIQKLHDEYIKKIDTATKSKEQELAK